MNNHFCPEYEAYGNHIPLIDEEEEEFIADFIREHAEAES